MAQNKDKDQNGFEKLVINKRARFSYHILEDFEAGLVLFGSEVKSLRAKQVNIEQSFISIRDGEAFIFGMHINPYEYNTLTRPDPDRTRKVLLHKHQILKFEAKLQRKGLTIVPLEIYIKKGKIKLKIGLAEGKSAPDKRDTVKQRDLKREVSRSFKGKLKL